MVISNAANLDGKCEMMTENEKQQKLASQVADGKTCHFSTQIRLLNINRQKPGKH